ncbi:HEPN domain-containing protein [Micromonospora sp. NPDC050417]|uniref:ApeA N-terminal domain 1-containing protein n=1 Tax=Micromonospora sp. NPDC050417 TaxID=3364280 RepID=UPI0037A70262
MELLDPEAFMPEKIGAVHEGTIGWFWPGQVKPRSWKKEPERGYLKLADDNRLQLVLLDESDSFKDRHGSSALPRIITGATESGGVLLLDIVGRGSTRSFGGASASVLRYRARSLIVGVDIKEIRSANVHSIATHYFGISSWLGLSAVVENWQNHNGSNRLKSFTITADVQPEQSVMISGGRELVISAHWEVGGPEDRRTVLSPVSIACQSKSPKHLAYLRYPLLRIQDLISLAYDGFVAADDGRAVPHIDNELLLSTPSYWDSLLMATSNGDAVKDRDLPYFHCADIGGLAGLARWTSLCYRHLRAVRPIVERYRQGKASPPLRLMEVAAGIEYWVAAHRPSTQWARRMCPRRGHRCGYAWTLATHVGSPFAEWIGDVDTWAQEFWSTYNKLKHEPGYDVDERKCSLLAESALLLLAAALLNRVATNKTPSKRIFQGSAHRTWQLREALQKVLGT